MSRKRNPPAPVWLTPEELASRWAGHCSLGTLRNWRALRPPRGPAFQKTDQGRVLYSLAAVQQFETTTTMRRSPQAAASKETRP